MSVDAFSRETRSLLLALRKVLRGELEPLIDDVLGDLQNCARKRVALGDAPDFWERVWDVYDAGGWPCGCSDDLELFAFFPQ